MPDTTFDLTITPIEGGFVARAAAPGVIGEIGPQPVVLPFAVGDLPQQRRDAARWIKDARMTTRRGSEEQRLARSFGSDLFRALFYDDLGEALRVSLHTARSSNCILYLRLHLPPILSILPWELLYDTRTDQFLALAPDIALVRYVDLAVATTLPLIDAPLRIVTILASPDSRDYPPLHLDRELHRIEAALLGPIKQGLATLDVIRGRSTLAQVRARIREPLHVLHIIAHGDLDLERGEGVLIFEDEDGTEVTVGAELLRQYLARQRGHLRLVVLNACLGALPADPKLDPFASLGVALLQGGVPTAIAMQFEIPDDTSAALSEIFYEGIVAGETIGQALAEARRHLYGQYTRRLDWAIPVLFARATDGALVKPSDRRSIAPTHNPLPPILPLAPSHDIRLLRARSRMRAGRLDEALPLYEELRRQFVLPEEDLAHMELARIAAVERQQDWEQVTTMLEAFVQRYPIDDAAAHRLVRAREEVELARLTLAVQTLVAEHDWETAADALAQIDRLREHYRHPTIDLSALRITVRRAIVAAQAIALTNKQDWSGVVELVSALPTQFIDNDLRSLLSHAKAKLSAAVRPTHTPMQTSSDPFGVVLIQREAGSFQWMLDQIERMFEEQPFSREALCLATALIIEAVNAPFEQRLRAARLIGSYGDPRPGVCKLPLSYDDVGYWAALIPHGEYIIAGTDTRLRLGPFRVARYPVTVWQFRQFIEAGGYSHERWWTGEGRKWRRTTGARFVWQEEGTITQPLAWDDPTWTAHNQPVVGVSWYEAVAFSRWLNAHVSLPPNWSVRLPTEAEWEVAAMWDSDLNEMRPWQPASGELCQNVIETAVGRTTPVGLFPQGISPCGALDMAGNVWEWCLSLYENYPQSSHIMLADYPPGQIGPALRGGSFTNGNTFSTWGTRYWNVPNDQFIGWGFRLVVAYTPNDS